MRSGGRARDEANAVYALFGTFYVGLRFQSADIGALLSGTTPEFKQKSI